MVTSEGRSGKAECRVRNEGGILIVKKNGLKLVGACLVTSLTLIAHPGGTKMPPAAFK